MKKFRVAIILYNDLWIDVRVLNQIKILKERFEIFVLCTSSEIDRKEGFGDVIVEGIPSNSLLEKFRFISSTTNGLFDRFWSEQISSFVRKHRADLLHAHDLYMLPACIAAKKQLGTPLIIDLHENYPEAFKSYSWIRQFPHRMFVRTEYWHEVEKQFLQLSDGVVVLSNYFKKLLLRRNDNLRSKNIAVYPNVPDIHLANHISEPQSIQHESFRIFYFGMIGVNRGLHIVTEGLRRLRKDGMKVEFHIAGKVHKHDEKYFKEEVLDTFVKHTPWIDLKDLGAHIRCMDVCVSPILKNEQHESGLANKVFQYMLFAKPLIVSNCFPQVEIVEENNCGLYYHDTDPIGFSNCVKQLLNDPITSNVMGKNGRAAVLSKYNTKVMGGRLISLYESILKSTKTSF